jgi:hypothetical protein
MHIEINCSIMTDNTPQQENTKKPVALKFAIGLSILSFGISFCIGAREVGANTSNAHILFQHPAALRELFAQAVGMSLVFPAANLGIASVFKSMRNSNSRRKIFIAWGAILSVIYSLQFFAK